MIIFSISSDSDDDIILNRIKKKPAADGDEESSLIPEARSRSLTPPPGVDQLTRLRAKQVVQYVQKPYNTHVHG